MRNRIKTTSDMPNEDELEAALLEAAMQHPQPPKQVIMYYAKDDDPNRLYTIAYLEDVTVDRIAKRVVEMLDQRRSKVVDLTGKKRKRKS